jgi:hypothetical protein
MHYLTFLEAMHRRFQVGRYLEIGTATGATLALAVRSALAIDPHFRLDKAAWTAKPGISLFEMTSDEFFARHEPRAILGGTVDLAFIDGMHLSECVLRDFVNVERYCAKDSFIVLHDAIPQNFEMTERTHRPASRLDTTLAGGWTGDVWRVVPLLRCLRPDLHIEALDCPSTGLVIVSNLNPQLETLRENIDGLAHLLAVSGLPVSAFWSYIETLPVVDSRQWLQSQSAARPTPTDGDAVLGEADVVPHQLSSSAMRR